MVTIVECCKKHITQYCPCNSNDLQ